LTHELQHDGSRRLHLDQPGRRPDDNSVGLHANVVIDGNQASIFYLTHPGRDSRGLADQMRHAGRRTSIQVARLRTEDGTLRCDRDQALFGPVLPDPAAVTDSCVRVRAASRPPSCL
jgi:hypothetical protein